jgi:glucokinase
LIKIYSAAIANHIAHHMPTGGLYLVGSITNSLLPRLKDKDILAAHRKRHPPVAHFVEKVPLVVCKEIDLGLKGAFFVGRSILLE